LRPYAGDDLVDRDLRGNEPRLRLRVGLSVAADFPGAAGHRPWRRGPGRRGLHQRAHARATPRTLRAALRAGVSGRTGRREPARALDRAESRLAMDVLPRCDSCGARPGAPRAAAGIAALARHTG